MAELMIDVDDVLFPWADEVHRRSGIAGLHDGSKPWNSWHMWEDYGCSKEAWLDVVSEATIDGMYVETPPIPGSAEALRRLWWAGHRIHVVTARGFMEHATDIREWTHQWFSDFALPWHTMTFAKDKVAAQDELGIRYDFAVDDGVHNYEALDKAGVPVYLVTRHHNQTFPAARRVKSLGDFADLVIQEAS